MTLRGVLGRSNNHTATPTSNPTSAPTSNPTGNSTSGSANGENATPHQFQQRHGSADSYRSTDTVKGPGEAAATAGSQFGKLKSGQRIGLSTEPAVSPGSLPFTSQPYALRTDIAPWDDSGPSPMEQVGDRSRSEFPIHQGSTNTPAINRQPPVSNAAPPWTTNKREGRQMASSVFGGYFGESSENLGQVSPGFAPPGGMGFPGDGEDRRPSIASATTISSQGSRESMGGKFTKKLQGFFGEEMASDAPGKYGYSRQSSETSSLRNPVPGNGSGGSRNRNNSMNDAMLRSSGAGSPTHSRPRTPSHPPSSEVTPWVFQDPQEAGISTATAQQTEQSKSKSHKPSIGGHKLHLPGHRHNRSNDEKVSGGFGFPLKAATSRENIGNPLRSGSTMSSALNLRSRATSPSPSVQSAQSRDNSIAQRSPSGREPKRSLFDRVTGRHKNDKAAPESLVSPASTTSLQQQQPGPRPSKARTDTASISRPSGRKSEGNNANTAGQKPSRLPFKRRGETSSDSKQAKDPNGNANGMEDHPNLWNLDTDLTQMEGIIDRRQPPMTPPANDKVYDGGTQTLSGQEEPTKPEAGAWDAPDSWAVKRKTDENVERLREIDEDGNMPGDDDPGSMYFMRIFRADSTFAVISASLNTTAAELISMMAKKTFLQDELDNYQIVMRKQDTSRQLESGERPLVMQKRLLELAGYQENDKLEDLGREDHGYLCRFTFLPAKMSGYSSLERDPGFNKMQRFSHIDLSGRNLVTIPIAMYQKATEIITLNLSRNLKLDIPKDFIQSCTQLREIKYTSNEAWRIPQSLPLAVKLTMLDVSNNSLEQLEHAELHKLSGLVSLKLSNNILGSIPKYFDRFAALRSLNLSSNNLSEFPESLRSLNTLVDLDVSFNSISDLGDIGNFTNLERLWATNNRLGGPLHASFGKLTNLKEIDARFNGINNMDIVSQLPKLEMLMLGHNSISAFEGCFSRLKVLYLNHNPVTRFDLNAPVPTLSVLNLASAKLSQLPDALFMKMSNLTKLTISKNHFVSLSPHFGNMLKLEYLSIAKNELQRMPAEVGRLTELRYLDVRENNLSSLPPEIWLAKRLETLNLSSNVLSDFPKPGNPLPAVPESSSATPQQTTPIANTTTDIEELGRLEDFSIRRPSQASGMLSVSSSPGAASRKGSVVSHSSQQKMGGISRANTAGSVSTMTPGNRKDSTLSGRLASTFSTSLRHLFLADNRLEDDVFNELVLLPELRILNLSYNQLYDIPPRTIKRWSHLTELYLSGNDLSSLPAEDLEEGSSLKVLHINSNKFQVLPAELGKVQKLAILDVGSNMLKYNVSNWPYDWNWNWNHQLRYLNLSGNKRLEIKQTANAQNGREARDLTDFSSLVNLRILGLMDVTLTIPSIPDQAPDRRIRTAGSVIGTGMPYGMADTLGRNEHLSTLDMVVPRFRGHEAETLIGLFDGQSLSSGGSRVAKYLHEKFKHVFSEELDKIKFGETAADALRRTYLGLNKDLATAAMQAISEREHPGTAIVHRGSVSGPELGDDDMNSGSVATVMYLHGMDLVMSNVGDAQALLIQSEGGHRVITRKHDPAETLERQRIREAGGYVSRQGKLNDQLDVSRAFGYVSLTPCVIAAPHVVQVTLKESDEMILMASRELWDYLTPDFAVDVARSERGDLMRAAQKLRDLAIAFGATGKIMVMMIGVTDLRRRERARVRTHSMGMGPSGSPQLDYFSGRKGKRGRENVGDSKLARLDQEVEAPVGDVTLVFTDIKNSTILWETYPIAMRSAIRMHNEVMRRHLRIIGGYEVKTEGDAFMVAFPTVTSALLWCFTIQSQLLEVQWPQEILSSVHGDEVQDADGNVIFRGLSVRMGIHWGQPVCEVDPVTKRMDYFGPMVNRAARIEGVADGGQICVSSDFIAEVQRLLESHIETDRTNSTGSEETFSDDLLSEAIRRELRSLSSQGFEVKDLGQRTLKGLENPEYIYLMYPHSLASRLLVQQQKAEAEARTNAEKDTLTSRQRGSPLTVDTQNVWDLWNVSLRLEMLCSSLESTGVTSLKPPETALLERMKQRESEVTDRFLVNFVEHQISRIETCISTLAIRNMVRPFKDGMLEQACPMADVLAEVASQLDELKVLRRQADFEMAPA